MSPQISLQAQPVTLGQTEPGDVPNGALSQAALTSQQLMQGRKAIAITHNGTTYRLQATRLGKLILTK
jgi:hemin uptake protein HemP